jgi:hypothetical protein
MKENKSTYCAGSGRYNRGNELVISVIYCNTAGNIFVLENNCDCERFKGFFGCYKFNFFVRKKIVLFRIPTYHRLDVMNSRKSNQRSAPGVKGTWQPS